MDKIGLELQINVDHLVLHFENKSTDTLKIWNFDNSLGWNTISILIRKKEGKDTIILKQLSQMGWTRSGLSTLDIEPKGNNKIQIFPKNEWWETDSDLNGLKNQTIYMKAQVVIEKTVEAKEYNVFTGSIESKWKESKPPHKWLLTNF